MFSYNWWCHYLAIILLVEILIPSLQFVIVLKYFLYLLNDLNINVCIHLAVADTANGYVTTT